MKIGFFESEGWEGDILKQNFPNDEIFLSQEKLDAYNLPERKDFESICVFVNSKIDKAVLDNFPNLKFVTTRSTGYDHIDLKACAEKGVVVGFVPGYGNNTVAEMAFGLLLNLTRKIYLGIDEIKEKNSYDLKGLRGIDLKGKTIGVVGTGRIGKEAINIAKGFGMNIIAFDPFPDEALASTIGFKYVPFEELLKNSDVITIHIPYTEKTKHLINKNNIELFKKGAYLINTARGGIVETESLVIALKNGILAGAGLDVLEEEGEVKDEMSFMMQQDGGSHPEKMKNVLLNHILIEMPNVLITPHNAFNTQEAFMRILNTTMENWKGFAAGTLNEKNIAK